MSSFVPKKAFVAPTAPKCYVCSKSVYKMEEVIAIDKTWHKTCFKCGGVEGRQTGCGRTLTLEAYLEHLKEPYCTACHRRNFGAKGIGFGISTMTTEVSRDTTESEVVPPNEPPAKPIQAPPAQQTPDIGTEDTTHTAALAAAAAAAEKATVESVTKAISVSSISRAYAGASDPTPVLASVAPGATKPKIAIGGAAAPKCKMCKKSVYKMEEIMAMSHSWHKACFTCGGTEGNGCGRTLLLDNYTDHGSNPYCTACYGRLYRPKGVGYGNTLNTEEGHRTAVASASKDKHPSATFAGDGDEVSNSEW